MTRLWLGLFACGSALALGCQAAGTAVPTNRLGRTVSFQSEVVPILKNHCAGCHAVGRPADVVPMFDRQGAPIHQAIKTHFFHMLAAIEDGTMPRGRPGSVPAEQYDVLAAWWESGAPNN